MVHGILFVDDEPSVLNAIKRELRKEPFEVYTAQSTDDALEILNDKGVSVIVSDMQMPVMSGVEFLEKADKINSHAIKLILSGHSRMNDVMNAINKGHVWRYLTKPWEKRELLVTLNNAISFFEIAQEREKLLEELKIKNQELADSNDLLEQRVKEQTLEITNRNTLLRMLVNGEDIACIMETAVGYIAQIAQTSQLAVIDKNHSILYSSIPDLRQDDLERYSNMTHPIAGQQCQTDNNGNFICKLVCDNETYGNIIITNFDKPIEDINYILQGYGALLGLILRQNDLYSCAPQVIDNIKNILGELE